MSLKKIIKNVKDELKDAWSAPLPEIGPKLGVAAFVAGGLGLFNLCASVEGSLAKRLNIPIEEALEDHKTNSNFVTNYFLLPINISTQALGYVTHQKIKSALNKGVHYVSLPGFHYGYKNAGKSFINQKNK